MIWLIIVAFCNKFSIIVKKNKIELDNWSDPFLSVFNFKKSNSCYSNLF